MEDRASVPIFTSLLTRNTEGVLGLASPGRKLLIRCEASTGSMKILALSVVRAAEPSEVVGEKNHAKHSAIFRPQILLPQFHLTSLFHPSPYTTCDIVHPLDWRGYQCPSAPYYACFSASLSLSRSALPPTSISTQSSMAASSQALMAPSSQHLTTHCDNMSKFMQQPMYINSGR